MVLHPDVQAKGQEEIGRVVGRDRLPTFEDRFSLPYVEAIYRELMRLHPPAPLGKCLQMSELLCDFEIIVYQESSIAQLKMIAILVIVFRKVHSLFFAYSRPYYALQGCSVVANIWCVGQSFCSESSILNVRF